MPDIDVPNITPDQVQDLVSDGWTLVDVRTDEEWEQGRIPGSQHLSLDQVVQQIDTIGNKVICVCASGGRSWRVTQYLILQGVDAVNLDGGLQSWQAAGHPIEP